MGADLTSHSSSRPRGAVGGVRAPSAAGAARAAPGSQAAQTMSTAPVEVRDALRGAPHGGRHYFEGVSWVEGSRGPGAAWSVWAGGARVVTFTHDEVTGQARDIQALDFTSGAPAKVTTGNVKADPIAAQNAGAGATAGLKLDPLRARAEWSTRTLPAVVRNGLSAAVPDPQRFCASTSYVTSYADGSAQQERVSVMRHDSRTFVAVDAVRHRGTERTVDTAEWTLEQVVFDLTVRPAAPELGRSKTKLLGSGVEGGRSSLLPWTRKG